jgi:hypothetical protein
MILSPGRAAAEAVNGFRTGEHSPAAQRRTAIRTDDLLPIWKVLHDDALAHSRHICPGQTGETVQKCPSNVSLRTAQAISIIGADFEFYP